MHGEGKNRASRGTTIPQKFMEELDIQQGSYIKMYLDKNKEGSKKIRNRKIARIERPLQSLKAGHPGSAAGFYHWT